jgi:hypothetical protein
MILAPLLNPKFAIGVAANFGFGGLEPKADELRNDKKSSHCDRR